MAFNPRSLGTLFNRAFRNDLNANFTDVKTELDSQDTRIDNLVVSAGDSNAEIVDARGGETTLGNRLDSADAATEAAQSAADANATAIGTATLKTTAQTVKGAINENYDQIGIVLGTGVLGEMYPRLSGETDDALRINRALAALNGSGGTLKFGQGLVYTVKSALNLNNLSNIILDGNKATLKVGGTTEINTILLGGSSKIEIKGFNFDGSNSTITSNATASSRYPTIYCGTNCNKINIHDNYFVDGTGGAIMCYQMTDSIITNNRFENGKYHAIFLANLISNVRITKNLILNYLSEGIKINGSAQACTKVIISKNTIRNLTKEGSNYAIGIEIDHQISNFIVTGNIIDTCGDMGISMSDVSKSVVTGNYINNITGYGVGIEVAGTTYTTVSHNVIDNCSVNNIILDTSSDNELSSNIIKGGTRTDYTNEIHGIMVSGTSSVTTARNIITNNKFDGFTYSVYLNDYSDKNSVVGNEFTNGFVCVLFGGSSANGGSTNAKITDNFIENFGNIGIRMSNAQNAFVSHNRILGKGSANGGSGIAVDNSTANTKIVIANNFIQSVWTGLNFNSTSGSMKNSIVKNNTIDNATNIVLNAGAPTSTVFDKNLYYNGTDWVDAVNSYVSVSDKQLTTTSSTTVASANVLSKGNFEVKAYYRVVTASTNLTITVTYTDGTGSQTYTLVPSASQPVGFGSVRFFLNAVAGSTITVSATAGTANQAYVSATIKPD